MQIPKMFFAMVQTAKHELMPMDIDVPDIDDDSALLHLEACGIKKLGVSFGTLCVVCLAACTTIQLDERPSQSIDLSGEWILDSVASQNPDLVAEGVKQEWIDRRPRNRRDMRRMFEGSSLAFISHDFHVLNAEKLYIEQGTDSLGIQYYPGVYRDVSWGERDRGLWAVEAGWQALEMVIVSDAPEMRVIERFDLVAPQTLRVIVTISADGEEREITRVFDRQE